MFIIRSDAGKLSYIGERAAAQTKEEIQRLFIKRRAMFQK